jgi:hypothetical protein
MMGNAEMHPGMGPVKLLLDRSNFSMCSLSKHISAGTKPESPLAAMVQKMYQPKAEHWLQVIAQQGTYQDQD